MLKRLFELSCLLFMMAATAFAHEKGDSITYTFSFKAGSDMFYVPYSENETELDRLEQFIEKYKNPIIDGRLPLMVDGYCKSAPDDARNLRIAAIRSNRVKSELILRRNLREDCFITRNHADGGDYVTVRVTLPVETVANDEHLQPSQATEETPQQEQPDGEKAADTTESHMQSQENTPATTHTDSSSGHSEEVATSSTENSRNHGLSVRANLLRWATLTPDVGIEWHIGRHLSIMANGLAGNTPITTENDDYQIFKDALYEVLSNLTRMLAKDGEGASKLLECTCAGAPDLDTAIIVAKSVIRSPLLKCAMFGEDANWGRILCAIGYAEADFDIDKVELHLRSTAGSIKVCENGAGVDFSEEEAAKILHEDEIYIDIDLHQGDVSAKAWGCDLTYDYVKINGDYRS